MKSKSTWYSRLILHIAVVALWFGGSFAAAADLAVPYQPIESTLSDTTITLTGHDLTIEKLTQIARHGARVRISDEAKQRTADAYGLLLQGAAEDVPIYRFNRGAGEDREVRQYTGEAFAPETVELIQRRQRQSFERGPSMGYGPEVAEEEIVRAFMAARANNITFEAISPQFLDLLVEMLNRRVTPVLQARGTVGEADLLLTLNVLGTMVGKGEAYYQGVRMPAAEALRRAGLETPDEFGLFDSSVFVSTNAYSAGWAGLLVADAREMLEWIDLLLAMDLNAMNSSITPLSLPVQTARAHNWLNWDAARVLDMLKGSYLFNDEYRTIQDPESLRASSIRQGSAWQAWSVLRDSVLAQINTSDQNPAVVVGLTPEDSWELATPQMMKYYVRGGEYSNGKSGYIVSNANWDPYPLANDIEYFTNALQNVGVAVALRLHRFNNPFFTVATEEEILANDPTPPTGGYAPKGGGFVAAGLWQDVKNVAQPLSPQGFSIDVTGIGDLEAQTRLKAHNLNLAIDYMFDLMGQDLLTAAFWMDLRKIEDPDRTFGDAPTAAWQAFREVVPFRFSEEDRPQAPVGREAYRFLRENPASNFYPGGPPIPGGSGRIPVALGAVGN